MCTKDSAIEILSYPKCHPADNMKETGILCSSCVCLFIFSALLLNSVTSLMCWQYSGCSSTQSDDHWNIRKCVGNETTCLAQYRMHNSVQIPSYFGCHTAKTPCNHYCKPTEGQNNDYSCCCSGDLCNSLPVLTPNRSDPNGTYISLMPG